MYYRLKHYVTGEEFRIFVHSTDSYLISRRDFFLIRAKQAHWKARKNPILGTYLPGIQIVVHIRSINHMADVDSIFHVKNNDT